MVAWMKTGFLGRELCPGPLLRIEKESSGAVSKINP
jgi:hypothetical protein